MSAVIQFILAHQVAFSTIGAILLQEFVRVAPFIKGNSILQVLELKAEEFLKNKAGQPEQGK